MCCHLFTDIALLELLCHCFICVDCLGRHFESALSSREVFPPKMLGKALSVHRYANHLQPQVVRKYMAPVDE